MAASSSSGPLGCRGEPLVFNFAEALRTKENVTLLGLNESNDVFMKKFIKEQCFGTKKEIRFSKDDNPGRKLQSSFDFTHDVAPVTITTLNAEGKNIDLKGHLITINNEIAGKTLGREVPKSEPKERQLILYFGGSGAPAITYLLEVQHLNRVIADHAVTSAGKSTPYTTYDILVVDRRGFGHSEGSPSRSGMSADAEAIYQFALEQGYQPENMTLIGYSMGGQEIDELRHTHPEIGRCIGDRVVRKVSAVAKEEAPRGLKGTARERTSMIFREAELDFLYKGSILPRKIELIIGKRDSDSHKEQAKYYDQAEILNDDNDLDHFSSTKELLKKALFPEHFG